MSRPIIGITCDYDIGKQTSQLYRGYYDAVLWAGGLPLLIADMGGENPYIHGKNSCIHGENIKQILNIIDGILFTGGQDVEPAYFGETVNPKSGPINPYRDDLEIPLCRMAMERDIPILGICRGIQLMNIAMGGTIYQDLDSQWDKGKLQKHSQQAPEWYGSHEVELVNDSKLAEIIGDERPRVNSFHHQAIKDPAPCFEVTAKCGDGVAEGIESPSHPFVVGVQWHPERMWERDKRMLGIFKGLVEAARC